MLTAWVLLTFFLGSSLADHFPEPGVCVFYKNSCNFFELRKGCCEYGLTAGEITCIVLAVILIIVGIIVICMFCRGCPLYNMRHAESGGKIFCTSPASAPQATQSAAAASAPPMRAVTTTVLYPDWQRSQEYQAYPLPAGNTCSMQQIPDPPPAYTPAKHQ